MSSELAFIAEHPDAAVITLRSDGSPHAARVELGVVGGRVQSSGSPGLVRSANVRSDPRCTLFVFGPAPLWLGVDATARILDGPNAVDHCIALLQARHGHTVAAGYVLAHDDQLGTDRRYGLDEYREHVRAHGLFVFDFEIARTYGNFDQSGG